MRVSLLASLVALAGAEGAPSGVPAPSPAVEAVLAAAPSVLAAPAPLDLEAVRGVSDAAKAAVAMKFKPAGHRAAAAAPSLVEEAATSVPVEDQLPSMSPMDGLDRDLANGPLPNPRPLKGEPNQEIKGYPSSGTELLPSAGEVLGTAPSAGKTYLTPGLSLPPIYGHSATSSSPEEKSGLESLELPASPLGGSAPSASSSSATAGHPETPAHAAFTSHPWRVSPSIGPDGVEHGNALRAPYVAPPASEWARAYAEMTGTAMPGLPLFHQHVLTGDVRPPTSAFEAFLREKRALEGQRAHYMHTLKARMAAIEHARSFVNGGSAWVSKMKAEWDAWLEKERAKGSQSITAEERKVKQQEAVLESLERQQREDMKRINLYNSKIRQAAMQFKLGEHRAKLEKEAKEQEALKERLEASQRHQAEVEARIAKMTEKMAEDAGDASATKGEGGEGQEAQADAAAAPAAAAASKTKQGETEETEIPETSGGQGMPLATSSNVKGGAGADGGAKDVKGDAGADGGAKDGNAPVEEEAAAAEADTANADAPADAEADTTNEAADLS